MIQSNKNIRETNIIGKGVTQSGVHASQCPALLKRGYFSVGYVRICGPYHIVRMRPDFEHITLCYQGSGRSLIRGSWVPFRDGHAVLSPRLSPHGSQSSFTHATTKEMWGLVWVVFSQLANRRPRIPANEATLIEGSGQTLLALVQGLEREVVYTGDESSIFHWVELIERFVERLLSRQGGDPRLTQLWRKIQQNLSLPWKLSDMARETGLSEGHLRRLCNEELGFSPRHQLARLRIKQTSMLLSTTNMKLDQIAATVGYSDPFALSTAYHRLTGSSPRQFRQSLRGR